jgi:hypothetical protein
MSPLISVLVPVLVMPAPPPNAPKVEAAPRLGRVGPVAAMTVKLHGFGAEPGTKKLPNRSVTRFEIVAVYCVPVVRLARGVNVAIWLTGS